METTKKRKASVIDVVRISNKAFSGYKLKILLLTGVGIISGLFEGIGINAMIPLFSFVIGNGQGGNDTISRAIKAFFYYLHIPFTLKFLLIFIFLLFVFREIFSFLCYIINVKIITGYEERTRTKLFSKTMQANWPYLLNQKVGYLENVILTDIQNGKGLLTAVSSYITILINIGIYSAIAINISAQVTLLTLVLGGSLFFLIRPLMSRSRMVGKMTSQTNKEVSHFVNQSIMGIKTIKAMQTEPRVIDLGKEYFRRLRQLSIKSSVYSGISGSSLQIISVTFICLVFAIYYKMPNFDFAVLIAILYLIQRMFGYITTFQVTLQKTSELVPYLMHVLEYQDKAVEFTEKKPGQDKFVFNDSFEFSNIKFYYRPEKIILNDVNFIVKKGEMVGLIGPSGSGKTTIVDLALRLFSPVSGEILMDGKNVEKINLDEWRNNIGYVSQDVFLLNDTIENNIKFYNDSITEEKVIRAAKMANIYDFVEAAPEKFKTTIGDRGIMLSVGQRQRIVIARVLAREPRLLIFDEATSALDNESELKIQKVIENLRGKITVLVIAHRLSTIINSDRLIVIEKGRIVETGTPQELLKDKETYFYKVYNIKG